MRNQKCISADFGEKEKRLGMLTSVISGVFGNILMYLFGLAGVPVQNASALMSVITNATGYALDILVAKQCFTSNDSQYSYRLVSLRERGAWLIRSLMSFAFVRFLITVAIDIVVSTFMLRYARSVLDSAGILVDWKWRDTILSLLITFLNFNLFINRIRFDWAYTFKPNPALDLIMFSWFTSLIVSHIIFEQVKNSSTKDRPPAHFSPAAFFYKN